MAKDKYVELLNDNFILDIKRLLKVLGKEDSFKDLRLYDVLGVMGDYPSAIGQILMGKYRLILTWDKCDGLSSRFSSDKDLQEFIKEYLEEAYHLAIKQQTDYIYTLDISQVENYPNFPLNKEKELVGKQMTVFMPIICRFMVNAFTDNLE